MHLAPFLSPEKLLVLDEAERRLTNSGSVSTVPAPSSSKGKKKNQQGNRTSKKQIFNKYYYK